MAVADESILIGSIGEIALFQTYAKETGLVCNTSLAINAGDAVATED
jgi:hypothetical protein